MANLLYIKASPMRKFSYSLAVADAFVEAYRQSHHKELNLEYRMSNSELRSSKFLVRYSLFILFPLRLGPAPRRVEPTLASVADVAK